MSDNDNQFLRFLGELQRRRTFRVSAAYIVVAWVLIEVSSVVLEAFGASSWILPTLIIVLVAGLPVAIILSWIFDITPEGLQRTDDLDIAVRHAAEDLHEDIPAEVKPSIAVPLGTAERRPVSILRCTFRLTANGNAVSDPEIIMAAMPRLNDLVAKATEKFSAYPLDASGPVFELLFGYPSAFENDAFRAVAAAFAIRKETQGLDFAETGDTSLRANCSASVHSEPVVIEAGNDLHDAAKVIGNSSLVAGWLQTLAPADGIGISESTRELLRDAIRCESLGEFVNPQTGEKTEVHQALQLVSPKEALSSTRPAPRRMIGRESELALALNRWDDVVHGEDQFIVLRGEPGIGKSTMVKAIIDKVSETSGAQLMPLYCSPFDRSNPFHPIVDYFFGPGLELADTESDAHKVGRVKRLLTDLGLDAEQAGPFLANLLGVDSGALSADRQPLNAETMRAGQLHCLLDLLHATAKANPTCVIFEDIHWADPSTLEFISMLVNREAQSGALCIFTTRPQLSLDWEARSNVTTLDLQRLSRRVTESLVRDILDNPVVGDELIQSIVSETGGNPLFVEELSKAISESITDTEFALAENLVLPGTVQQSLNARMDRLGDAKAVLQLCSLLGRRFDYQLLRSVSATENEDALRQDLQTIVNAEFLYQEGAVPNSSYRFKHVLMQEAARNSLLNATRVELHARVAAIIETEYAERTEKHPALLGYHHSEGGQPDKAVGYWTVACQRSLAVYAMREAVDRAENGLDALERLPQSQERDAAEIRLRSLLGKGLLALHGYAHARVEENFTRAVNLSESMEEAPDFLIVVGLWMYFYIGGEAPHALSIARRLINIAETNPSPAKLLQAHYCAGYSLYRLGKFEEARKEIELALTFDAAGEDFSDVSASGDDTRLHAHAILSNVLWHLGDDQLAREHVDKSVAMGEEEENPVGVAFSNFHAAWLAMFQRSPSAAAEPAARVFAVGEELGLKFWHVIGSYMMAWSSCDGGRSGSDAARAERLQKLEVTLEAYLSSGATSGSTSLGLQIAEDFVSADELDRAETWINRIRSIVDTTGENHFTADLSRIEGRVAEARKDFDKAAALYAKAADVAKEAGSVGLVARATSDLAELTAGN